MNQMLTALAALVALVSGALVEHKRTAAPSMPR
jgi:hypothetical protein